MKSFSNRVQSIEPSITMKVSALAAQLKKEGKDVIGFGAGEPDFDTPEFVKAAGIAAIESGKNKYTPATGINELKSAVCNQFKQELGLEYEASQIVVSCGAKHSVFNVLAALVDPGDEVIIPAPYWVSYPQMVNLLDGKSVIVDADEANHFKVSAAQIEAVITSNSKVLILNSPSNPTGMIYTREELEAIAEVAVRHDLYVISDEIYDKLIYDGVHVSIATLGDEIFKRTIVVNGVSKSYSMTGWRIGYTASSLALAKAMGSMQSHVTSNPTSNSQWAALAALEGPQDFLVEWKTEFQARRDRMVSLLNAIPGFGCLQPGGAFYAFPNVSGCFGKTSPGGILIENSIDFCSALLEEALVALVPGEGFGAPGFSRLSYATSMAKIEEGLARIQTFCEGLS